MKPARIIALVLGVILVLPGIGALIGGSVLGLGYAAGRDDDGFFEASIDRLETPTVAVTAEDIDFTTDPGSPDQLIDALDADVRLRVTSASSERDLFVGIGPQAQVDAYLAGVAHDEVRGLEKDGRPEFRTREGGDAVDTPTEQAFWVVSASGRGTQEVIWEAESGRWAAVVMNADGAPGVDVDVDVGLKAGFVIPLAIGLVGLGLVLTVGSVALIVVGAQGANEAAYELDRPVTAAATTTSDAHSPVTLEAHLDPALSSWQWLVKWFLAIPHFVVLAFLWLGLVVTTVVAGFAILFTGRYPARLFDFNVGVLRWSWRVSYYATTGGIGTDQYPPFSLGPEPQYPATLAIERPGDLSRGLVLVKWWLLAIPHYLVIGLLAGGATASASGSDEAIGLGLLQLLTLVAGVILLFRKRYPLGLFDLIIGFNRWIYRVVAYVALMTDVYPPFRLDQGGEERPLPPEQLPPA